MIIHGNSPVAITLMGALPTRPTVALFLLVLCNNPATGDAWEFDPGKLMARETTAFNQQLPVRIDSETEMRSAAVFENAIVFKYVMTSETADWLKTNGFIARMQETLPATVCADPWSRDLFKKWPNLVYEYSGSDGRHVGKITVRSVSCH